MAFFQNVFGQEYQGFLNTGNDRNYSLTFRIPANQNNQDYQFAFNAEPYNLAASPNLTINYAWDTEYKNWSPLTINVAGSVAAQTKAHEVVSALNANATFSSMYEARVAKNNGSNHVLIVSKPGRAKQIIRMYVSNGGAESVLKFNKKAPIAELPCYFKRDTIENRFNFEPANNHLIELDPCNSVDADILTAAGFSQTPQEDWQLLRGRAAGIYNFKKQTVDGSDRVVEIIEYPAGAVEGDLARKTIYTYTDTNNNPDQIFQIPHCLEAADLIVPESNFIPCAEGSLWGMGEGSAGELGNNDNIDVSSPVQTITGGTNWVSVSGGYYNAMGLKSDGTLWGWGRNYSGQLGNNSTTSVSSPVQTVSLGTNWAQVDFSQSNDRCSAVKTDGTLWNWGSNTFGELGDNTTDYRSSPVQTVAGGTNWLQVATGGFHSAAIKTDGTLWLWGQNSYGELGNDNTTNMSSPVQTVVGGTDWYYVSCGRHFTAATKTDGSLWLWGDNSSGQLGNESTTNVSSPVQTVSFGTNWSQISCGDDFMTAIKSDGSAWLWGQNNSGQLGTNDSSNRSSPVQTISGDSYWSLISGGSDHTAALKTDGTFWVWGNNTSGRLGVGDTQDRSSPVQTVMSDNNWLLVSAGTENTYGIRKS